MWEKIVKQPCIAESKCDAVTGHDAAADGVTNSEHFYIVCSV